MVNGIGLGPDVKSCLATRGRKVGGTDLWGSPVGDQKCGTRLPAKGEREDGVLAGHLGRKREARLAARAGPKGNRRGGFFFPFSFVCFLFVSFCFKTISNSFKNSFESF